MPDARAGPQHQSQSQNGQHMEPPWKGSSKTLTFDLKNSGLPERAGPLALGALPRPEAGEARAAGEWPVSGHRADLGPELNVTLPPSTSSHVGAEDSLISN